MIAHASYPIFVLSCNVINPSDRRLRQMVAVQQLALNPSGVSALGRLDLADLSFAPLASRPSVSPDYQLAATTAILTRAGHAPDARSLPPVVGLISPSGRTVFPAARSRPTVSSFSASRATASYVPKSLRSDIKGRHGDDLR